MTDRLQPPSIVPAGWYPDPDDAAGVRYWNGFAWTDLRAPLPSPGPPPAPRSTPAWLLPTNVSGWAVASGYLGLITFVFLGIPGPFALASGILGLRQIRRRPGLNGKVRAWVGITFGTLGTALLVLIAIALLAE